MYVSCLVPARAQSTINGLLTEAFDAAAEELEAVGAHLRLERAILGPIGTGTRARFLRHILLLALELIKVTADRCVASDALVSAQLLDATTSEGWLIRLKEAITLVVVTSRADGDLRCVAGLDSTALAQAIAPIDGTAGRLLHDLLNDVVCAGADLAWIVHQPTHLADVTGIRIGLGSVDDRRQKARRDGRNRHLLQAGIVHSSGSATRRNWRKHGQRIDHALSTAGATTAPRWTVKVGRGRLVLARPRIRCRLLL